MLIVFICVSTQMFLIQSAVEEQNLKNNSVTTNFRAESFLNDIIL